ncbi:hypothetical protein B9Z55_012123 [Caenorhabditis nigoni]|uniref:Uncharacterized protein n=1 Tax=Caenorhabditis nigoni TaxID=1611254 RepID=A0A2G5TVX6_9PELO|nr:hypothetical protein B9Z55_012123 [Caenorhabditis nigoni]
MFLIWILLFFLIFLGVLVYFGTGFVVGKKKENGKKNVPLLLAKTAETENTSSPCEAPEASEDPEDPSISEDVSQNSRRNSEEVPEESIDLKLLKTEDLQELEPENSPEQDLQLEIDDWKTSKSPEGSPKSTSSCISSEISLDNVIEEEEELEDEQPSPMEFIKFGEDRLRPSSLPIGTFNSASTSSASIFNFSRKTPEFVPRMMLEEFEDLDRSIEKRKIDIRNLLKRIESAKRRHRRFSEEIQRVQIEHQIRY